VATYSPLGLQPLSESYGSPTAGQAAVTITPNIGGDSIALTGSYVILRIATAGTGATITLDSVPMSNFGTDVNVAVTLGATAVQYVPIKVDNRFRQTSGNIGYLNLTYSSVTTLTIEATYIP
jgi:hypothetical protein